MPHAPWKPAAVVTRSPSPMQRVSVFALAVIHGQVLVVAYALHIWTQNKIAVHASRATAVTLPVPNLAPT